MLSAHQLVLCWDDLQTIHFPLYMGMLSHTLTPPSKWAETLSQSHLPRIRFATGCGQAVSKISS